MGKNSKCGYDWIYTPSIKCAPKINSTTSNYVFYFKRLFQVVLRLFEYTGLPSTLPAVEIEKRLLIQGFAPIFLDEKHGYVTSFGSLTGISIYDYPTQFLYSQPILGSGMREIGKDGVVIYSSTLDKSSYGTSILYSIISWYARFLADIDTTIGVAVITNRMTRGVEAKTSQAYSAFTKYMKDIENGELATAFTSSGVLDGLQQILSHEVKSISISDLETCRSNVVKDFYNVFGLQYIMHKAERLIPDEVVNDTEYLSSFVRDLLECRQTGVTELNALTGLTVKVGVRK